jgi:hypothetical protein
MASNQWYYQILGEEIGPVSSNDLKSLVKIGTVVYDTSVRNNDSNWTEAHKIKGLFPDIDYVPPAKTKNETPTHYYDKKFVPYKNKTVSDDLLNNLFDSSFDNMITMSVARFLYKSAIFLTVVSEILLIIVCIAICFQHHDVHVFVSIIISIIAFFIGTIINFLYLLFTRLIIEFTIILFRIEENTHETSTT